MSYEILCGLMEKWWYVVVDDVCNEQTKEQTKNDPCLGEAGRYKCDTLDGRVFFLLSDESSDALCFGKHAKTPCNL